MIPIFLIIALVLGFYLAWTIGANDVANAMGTSVGSKAITIIQAIIIATIFEVLGIFLLGSNVTITIQRGIISPTIFADNPAIFINGMISVLLATALWLQLASFIHMPVSTTHSVVGSLIGFGITAAGIEAINWNKVLFILSSWLTSPLISAILAFAIFRTLQKNIFFQHNPFERTKQLVPFIILIALLTQSFIINYYLLISFIISFMVFVMVKIGLKYIQLANKSEHDSVETIFQYLQIFSACNVAFSHGANDVANAIGPVTAIVSVAQDGIIMGNEMVPSWLLITGALGIVIGLSTWGWRVIQTIGNNITELTATRGFSAEFATSLTVLMASKAGIPVSTTHVLVGAVLGVGMAKGLHALNVRTVRAIARSWVLTVPLCAIASTVIFYIISPWMAFLTRS